MTDSRWELIVVALVAIAVFFSVSGTSWTPDRLRALMIAAGPLQREVDTQNKRYALRFIAVLTLAAACCAGLVGSIIWIISDL